MIQKFLSLEGRKFCEGVTCATCCTVDILQEQFLKENFDTMSFTPLAMDKFRQQVNTLEIAAEAQDPAGLPFSPRLSLSTRFLSRAHFGGITWDTTKM